jgi:hypothetical protein
LLHGLAGGVAIGNLALLASIKPGMPTKLRSLALGPLNARVGLNYAPLTMSAFLVRQVTIY